MNTIRHIGNLLVVDVNGRLIVIGTVSANHPSIRLH